MLASNPRGFPGNHNEEVCSSKRGPIGLSHARRGPRRLGQGENTESAANETLTLWPARFEAPVGEHRGPVKRAQDDKRFWVFQKEKKHSVYNCYPKKIDDICFLSSPVGQEQEPASWGPGRDWPCLFLKKNARDSGGRDGGPASPNGVSGPCAHRLVLGMDRSLWRPSVGCAVVKADAVGNSEEKVEKPQQAQTRVGSDHSSFGPLHMAREPKKSPLTRSKDHERKEVQTIMRKTVSNPTKQLKNTMTGVTQGYTKNLELRGIGFQGKIVETPALVAFGNAKTGKTTAARRKENVGVV